MVRQKVPKLYFQSQFSMSKIDGIFDRDARRSGPTIHFVGLGTLVKIIVNSSLFVLLWIKGPLKGFRIQ